TERAELAGQLAQPGRGNLQSLRLRGLRGPEHTVQDPEVRCHSRPRLAAHRQQRGGWFTHSLSPASQSAVVGRHVRMTRTTVDRRANPRPWPGPSPDAKAV